MTESASLFGTPEYWRDVAAGRITWEQAEADQRQRSERSQRARQSRQDGRRTQDPRADRPAPDDSRQWCREMDTTAFRDDRLTMGAKALLAVIVAECGDYESTGRMLAKDYLSRRINRSARTVQRYLAQLRRFGYLAAEAVTNRAGWIIGQVLRPMPQCRPFWHPSRRRLAMFQGETKATPTNGTAVKTNALTQKIRDLARTMTSGAALAAPQIGAVEPRPG